MTTPKNSRRKRDSNPGSSALKADALTTRPTRRSKTGVFCVDTTCRLQGHRTSVLVLCNFLMAVVNTSDTKTHSSKEIAGFSFLKKEKKKNADAKSICYCDIGWKAKGFFFLTITFNKLLTVPHECLRDLRHTAIPASYKNRSRTQLPSV